MLNNNYQSSITSKILTVLCVSDTSISEPKIGCQTRFFEVEKQAQLRDFATIIC